MNPRILLLPLAVLAALALAAPEDAFAHGRRLGYGHGRRLGPHRGGVVVGGNFRIPIRQRGGHYREVVQYTGGFHETRTREVEVPGRQIGWDFRGEPIYAGSRIEVQTYQVWIPRRRIVRRVWVPARSVGAVTIGGRIRVR